MNGTFLPLIGLSVGTARVSTPEHESFVEGFGDLSEAEVVVFRSLGGGKFELVARVAPVSVWTEWAK